MDIHKWLKGNKKDYNLGVSIFESQGGSPVLLKLFKKGESAFNLQTLKDQLQNLANVQPQVSAPVKDQSAPVTPVTEPVAPTQEPAELKHIYELKLGAFKKMAALHQHMATITGNTPKAIETRLKFALEIMQLDELNKQCWDKIFYFKKHGKLPVDPSGFYPDMLTIRELVQLEKAIPTYITKLAKYIDNPALDDEARQKLYNRKAEWHIKAMRVKQELDALPDLKQIKTALCL
jgi:hypothetical protein